MSRFLKMETAIWQKGKTEKFFSLGDLLLSMNSIKFSPMNTEMLAF